MRNKRLIVAVSVLILVVFMLSLALVACKPKVKPEGKPDDGKQDVTPSGDNNTTPSGNGGGGGGQGRPRPKPGDEEPSIPIYAETFYGALGYMIDSMPSEYMSLNFEGYVTVGGVKYLMSLKGNISESELELSATFKYEEDKVDEGKKKGDVAFAIYIVNSKLFIQQADGSLIHVAEIDVNYLLSIVEKLPDLIGGLIGSLDFDISGILDLGLMVLLNGFASPDEIKYTAEEGVEKFEFALDVQGLFDPLIQLLGEGGLVGKLLPEGLDLSFIGKIFELIPKINGDLDVTVDHGRLTEFNLELRNNDPSSSNYQQPIFGLNDLITFSSTKLDLDIPADLYEELLDYETITLGNLNLDLALELDTGDEPFDVGALIDAFMGSEMFGKDNLIPDAHANYKFELQASLETNVFGGEYEEVYNPITNTYERVRIDKNYIHAVLWAGENEIVRANYLDGTLYLKVLAAGVNGFAEGGVNVAIKLPLNDYIQSLVKLITDAIDGFMGTEFRPDEAAAVASIVSASINRSGDVILTPAVQDIIVSILKLLGMQKNVEMGIGDHISILINKDLFAAIKELGGKDDEGNYKLELPEFLDVINGELRIGLFKGGIEYVEINAMDILTFRADNFYIGKAKIGKEDVLASIGDVQDYGEDIKSIILNFALSMLSDLDISIGLDVSTVNTVVNLTPIINSIMALANNSTYLKFPINLDLSKYSGMFKIRLATNYDNETGDGRILLEVITPQGDTLIAAYNENDKTYVDLAGLGLMKFCLTNVNLFQMIRTLLGVSVEEEDLAEIAGDTFTSSGVQIDNDSIGLAVDSYLLTTILRKVSMDLGLDAGVNAHLNFDGSVNAELLLGVAAKLGLNISLGKESESRDKRDQHRISEAIDGLAKGEFGEYNAIGAEMLVDSILNAEQLYFTIDLYNENIDVIAGDKKYNTPHDNKTRLVLRRSSAGAPGLEEKLGNGLMAPYRSLVIELYAGWTTSQNDALVYAYLDFNENKVQFKGTARMLSVKILFFTLTGEVLDIGIPNVDLRSMLINALSGIFESNGSAGSTGGIIDVPSGALPPQKPHRCSQVCPVCKGCLDADCGEAACATKCSADANGKHCTQKCEECGGCLNKNCKDEACATKCAADAQGNHPVKEATPPIEEILPGLTVTLTGNMDIDVDASLNGVFISKMLKDLLKGVFTQLDLGDMTGTGPVDVNYNNTDANTFFNSIYSQVLIPLIKTQVGNLATSGIGQIVGLIADNKDIKNQVHDLLQRFLPLPNVETIDVNVSLTDGKIANITAEAYNKVDYTDSSDSGNNRRTNQKFGIYIFNKKADEVISWEQQDTDIYFNRTFSGNLIDKFKTQVRTHTGKNWEVDSYSDIAWELEDGSMDLATFSSRLKIAQGKENYIEDGEYVFVGRATVASLNKTVQLSVKVTIDSAAILSIKDMEVKAMREIPTYVTAVLDRAFPVLDDEGNPVLDEDGNPVMKNDEMVITDVKIQTDNDRANAEEADESKGTDGKNATVAIGGKNYRFNLIFEEEILEIDPLELNAYDYVDKLNELEAAGTIRVKVNDTFYRNLPAEFNWTNLTDRSINVKKLSREDAQIQATYFVNVHVGKGTVYEQDMNMQIHFTPFDIYYIERIVEGATLPDYSKGQINELNYIVTDYIQDAYGTSFPEVINVVGFNGKEWLRYEANAEWNTDNVIIDLQGGQYFASVVINSGDYNQWTLPGIEVNVTPSDIVALANSSKTTLFDLKYYLYGGVDFEDCITSVLNFRTSNGTIKRNVPVTIDTSGIDWETVYTKAMNGEMSTIPCPVSIDVKRKSNGKSLFTTTVDVVIPSIKMALLDTNEIIDSTIVVDVSKEGFTTLDNFFNVERNQVLIKLGDDEVMAKVNWATDDVVVGVDGEYTGRIYIDRRGSAQQYCDIKIVITGNNVGEDANEEV